MIAQAKTKPRPFDVILVHKFDRFARSREDSVVYKSLLKKECGIKVVSITESIEDDKFSIILEAMLEAMAEYYSLNLSEEVKKGMTEKAERGGLQTSPSYGYDVKNNQLVINEEEAKTVRFIFQKFADREMNMRQLAIYLNELGVKSKRGNPIENRTIDYILNNPVYIGKLRWTTEKTKRDFHNPKSIIRDSAHEPIIDIDTWEKVQSIIKENKEIYRRGEKSNTNKISWLCGLLKCADCGYTLVRTNQSYFQCNGYVKGLCNKSSSIKITTVENLVLGEIKKIYTEKLEIKIVPKANDIDRQQQEELLTKRVNQTEMKELRIKAAYQDGIDSLEEYKQNRAHLSLERERLKSELEQLKNVIVENSCDGDIMSKLKSVYDVLVNPEIDMDIKYKTAHFLIDKIVFSKEQKSLKISFK
jgi:DNA invertase Pin-like site-specific DNA recombinase